MTDPRVAVLLPAYNEAPAIGRVIADARRLLPGATIYVYDNNSTDDTAAVARAAGAVTRFEPRQGKGLVVMRMFADIEADIYLMVDADDTYDLDAAPGMIALLLRERLDMVVGVRAADPAAHRPGHALGNRAFNRVVQALFGRRFTDIFSGFRVFSRRFVKTFPTRAGGFDIETDMTIHALELKLPCRELPVRFRERAAGTASKLRTVPDGLRILLRILQLLKDCRPFLFFSAVGLALAMASLAVGAPVVMEFIATGLVPKLPSAVLAMGLGLLSALSLGIGIVLDTVSRARLQTKLLAYLAQPWLGRDATDRRDET